MIKILLLLLAVPVSGFVRNARTGAGIPDIVVSDGYSCVMTGDDGRYEIDADSLARTISVCVPAEYEFPLDRDGIPVFFRYIGRDCTDFTLRKRSSPVEHFSVIAIADAHLRDLMNFRRLREESLPDLRLTANRHGKDGPVIGISLGDQLWDVMEVGAKAKKNLSSIKGLPMFYCIGNHDHNNKGGGTEYAVTDYYVRNFGPVDYSFDIGKAHVIVMDNIQYTGTQKDGVKISYKTGITDAQLEWLREDISLVRDKSDKVVIFCCHSPMFGRFSHKDDVRSLLGEFAQAHVLSGHEHNINNVWIGKIWEHNIQSIGGAWWYSNLAPNGSPLGYAVLSFEGAALAEEYNKATTESDNFQMRVYDGNASYGPDTPCPGLKSPMKRTNVYEWPQEMRGCFVARIWDGTPDWDVKLVYDGQEIPMEHTAEKFFDACSCAYMVDVCGAPYGGSSVYKQKVDSFWSVKAPGGDPAALKGWEVVATHKMPSGQVRTYKSSVLMQDYLGFGTGKHYLR